MTEKQYSSELALIERLNPKEPLLSALRKGWSKINVIYIKIALKRLPTDEIEAPKSEKKAFPRPTVKVAVVQDDTLRSLYADKSRLFGLMNKQSNEFHGMKTDVARKDNSMKVLAYWDDIKVVKAKIAHYEEYGELPEVIPSEEQIPTDAIALMKKINSIRARISKCKARIREIAGLDPNTPGKESSIQKEEEELKKLKHMLGLAELNREQHEQIEH